MRRSTILALSLVVCASTAWAAVAVDNTLRRKAGELFCGLQHTGSRTDPPTPPRKTAGTDGYRVPHFPGHLIDFWGKVRGGEGYNPKAFGNSLARMSAAYWNELTSTTLDKNPKTPRIELHTSAVAWAAKALAPRPADPLCGTTAQGVYDAQFRPRARYALRLLERLERDPAFNKVSSWRDISSFSLERVRADLAETRLESSCVAADAALGRDTATLVGARPHGKGTAFIARSPAMRAHTRAATCAFFLRRKADGSLPLVASTFRDLMTAFDPGFSRR